MDRLSGGRSEAFLRAVKTDYNNFFGPENDADEFQILIDRIRRHPNILKEIEKNRDVFFISHSETTAEFDISIFFNRLIGDMSIFVEGIWASSVDELATKLKREEHIHAEIILELIRNSLVTISKDGALTHKNLSHVQNPSKSKQWAARAIDNTGKVVPVFRGTMG